MSPRIMYYVSLLLTLLATRCTQFRAEQPVSPAGQVKVLYVEEVNQLLAASARLDSLLRGSTGEADVQQAFRSTRLAYKRIEPLLEQYNPELAKKLNGPAIDKHDLEAAERKVWAATGFQVVEEYLFPKFNVARQKEASRQMAILHGYLQVYRNDVEGLLLTDRNIFEALRLEILRMMSLGISGFDSPMAFHSLPEAHAALEGIGKMLSVYRQQQPDSEQAQRLTDALEKAQAFLNKSTSFDAFDRLTFIKEHLDVISRRLYDFQRQLAIANNPWPTAVNLDEPSFLSEKTFNPDFFAPVFNRNVKPEAVALGKILFHEPMLSGNNRRSCASCHAPEKAFTDGLAKSKALNGKDDLRRNAPTLINATFQRLQFYDSRTNFLEGQVADVLANPEEMHGSVYSKRFAQTKSKKNDNINNDICISNRF